MSLRQAASWEPQVALCAAAVAQVTHPDELSVALVQGGLPPSGAEVQPESAQTASA
jgi:hypothetical protein